VNSNLITKEQWGNLVFSAIFGFIFVVLKISEQGYLRDQVSGSLAFDQTEKTKLSMIAITAPIILSTSIVFLLMFVYKWHKARKA